MTLLPHASLLAQTVVRTKYDFTRMHALTEWWHWLLVGLVILAVGAYVVWMYRRDGREMPRGLTVLLALFRAAAFLGLFFVFLGLERRTERDVIRNSRVVMMVDTSQSMGLADADATSVPAGPSRIEQVIGELAGGALLDELRKSHDVVVMSFDQNPKPAEIASYKKRQVRVDPQLLAQQRRARVLAALAEFRTLLAVAAGLLLAAVAMAAVFSAWRLRSAGDGPSWALFAAGVLLVAGVAVLAVANLRNPDVTLAEALAGAAAAETPPPPAAEEPPPDEAEEEPPEIDWRTALRPLGLETRLGDNLLDVVNRERGGSTAAVVVFSDGNSNAGISPTDPIEVARDAGLPIYTVGLGSAQRPVNVRVVDLEAPPRVYPGDAFTMTGYLQSNGLEGRTVGLTLYTASAEPGDDHTPIPVEDRRITLGEDHQIAVVRFEVKPDRAGRRIYTLRVAPPREDHDARDNERSARVEIVERKNRVLLVAGGPTREFQFLRNMLFRDRDSTVDVYLQTGRPGISQDADEVLFSFPSSEAELFDRYDCIVAFDPDWLELTDPQIRLLERWVAEQAGGLIVVAGPVYTPQWSSRRPGSDARIDTLRALYPVAFYGRGTALGLDRFGSEEPWPLQFTREGQTAEFLWLADDPLASEATWATFEGVYGYYAVKDAKPGATVYARFADPDAAIDGELPIYMAGQFYGSGQVFFMGSGEMWRVRAIDDGYFEQLWTRLIRHVSQGRLLRDSSRGVLLVSKDRCLMGETIVVRAQLMDAQHQPLRAAEIEAALIQPDSIRQTLRLEAVKDSPREGLFSGQFTALQEGDYRIELIAPGDDGDDVLMREVRVRVPDLELENPERNDRVLGQIARDTGGVYYVGMDAALGRAGLPALYRAITPQDLPTTVRDTPDRDFELRLRWWLLAGICGLLSLEWLIRRLSKLA